MTINKKEYKHTKNNNKFQRFDYDNDNCDLCYSPPYNTNFYLNFKLHIVHDITQGAHQRFSDGVC